MSCWSYTYHINFSVFIPPALFYFQIVYQFGILNLISHYCRHTDEGFLMEQFKFNFSGIMNTTVFQQISMTFFYALNWFYFTIFFIVVALELLWLCTDLTYCIASISRLCYEWDLRRRQQALQLHFFHAARPSRNYYISVKLMSAKSVLLLECGI